MTAQTPGFLQDICRIRNARRGRLSSWHQSGRNQDYGIISPGETIRPEENYRRGGSAAFHCYLPMPFNERAINEVENQNDIPHGQYFNIDVECYPDN